MLLSGTAGVAYFFWVRALCFDDRGLDGAILVDKEDQASLARMRAC